MLTLEEGHRNLVVDLGKAYPEVGNQEGGNQAVLLAFLEEQKAWVAGQRMELPLMQFIMN